MFLPFVKEPNFVAAKNPEPTLVLHDFTLIDGSGAAPRPHFSVLISSETITDILPAEKFRPHKNIKVVEGNGRFLIPGLWDAHVHLTYGDEAMLGVLVANGITSVRDMGGDLAVLEFWQDLIDKNKVVGPHIYHAGPAVDGPKPGIPYHLTITKGNEAAQAVRLLQRMGVDFVKIHTAVPRDAYFALAKECARLRIPFAGHIPVEIEPTEAAEAGQHSIEHIATLIEGKYMSRFKNENEALKALPEWIAGEGKRLAKLFAEKKTWFDPTLMAYDVRSRRGELARRPDPRTQYVPPGMLAFWDVAFPITDRDRDPEVAARREEFVKLGLEITRVMHEAGVGIVAGTDLGGRDVLPGFSIHDEILLLSKIMPAMSALQTATTRPAEMMSVANRTGLLKVGRTADIVMLKANPLQDSKNVSEIAGVVLRGQLLDRKALDNLLARAASQSVSKPKQ